MKLHRKLAVGIAVAGAIAAGALMAQATVGPKDVAFPTGFEKWEMYQQLNRHDVKQYRELYTKPEIVKAVREGKPIPLGWALDRDGRPTPDPKAGLEGSMLPVGGTKGAMLALVVELLVTALTGAALGFEASSFFVDEGNRPRLGQAFLVIDPDALAGHGAYVARVETLIGAMLAEEGVRLPGSRRRDLAAAAARDGVAVPAALLAQLEALAQ